MEEAAGAAVVAARSLEGIRVVVGYGRTGRVVRRAVVVERRRRCKMAVDRTVVE